MTPYGTGDRNTRRISWIRTARKRFETFPEGAQMRVLRALTIAAEGRKADIAKPLTGVGSGVFEVATEYRTDAYRTVYAVQLGEDIWVLHAFQKKATRGIKTPKREIDLIRERLNRLKKELRR
jgi:phage-related protein